MNYKLEYSMTSTERANGNGGQSAGGVQVTARFKPHYPPGVSPFVALRPSPVLAKSLSGGVAALLSNFAGKSGNGKWPNLPRAQIARRLTGLAANASKPDQASLNACGPAAITHLFIKRQPEKFVQFVIDLYDNGEAKFGSLTVSGDDLFGKNPASMSWSGSGPPLTDWMIFTALRRSMDLLIKFEGEPSDDASAITLPGDMEVWARDGIQYRSVKDEANKFLTKGLSHLKALNPSASRDIIILINVSGILGNTTKGGAKKQVKQSGGFTKIGGKTQAAFPNHWAVLEQPVTNVGSDLKATVWTWGQSGYVLQASESVWDSNYYGATICEM